MERLKKIKNFLRAWWANHFKKKPEPLVSLEKPKRKPIPKKLRDQVWEKYHGLSPVGQCYCCNINVERYNRGWHAAHVIADAKGGATNLDNLRVSCSKCNLSMGDQNLYCYIKNNNLNGIGQKNVRNYFKKHPSQINDKRTNNWKKK